MQKERARIPNPKCLLTYLFIEQSLVAFRSPLQFLDPSSLELSLLLQEGHLPRGLILKLNQFILCLHKLALHIRVFLLQLHPVLFKTLLIQPLIFVLPLNLLLTSFYLAGKLRPYPILLYVKLA